MKPILQRGHRLQQYANKHPLRMRTSYPWLTNHKKQTPSVAI